MRVDPAMTSGPVTASAAMPGEARAEIAACTPRGGDPDDRIVRGEGEIGELRRGEGEGVLGSFDGAEHGLEAAREQSDDDAVGDAEGGTAFDGIEDAETTGRARAEVDEASARGKRGGSGLCDLRGSGEGGGHGIGDGLIGGMDEGDDPIRREGVDIARGWVDALGFERRKVFGGHTNGPAF